MNGPNKLECLLQAQAYLKVTLKPGNTNWGGMLSTVDLLIKVAHLVKKENKNFNIKMRWSELVSTRRSTVLSLPSQ
jgi:hypothetical protein